MTGLDSNVLVRFLVADDPAQFARARGVVEEATRSGESLFLPLIVIAETVWVLDSRYGFSRQDIASTLQKLLETEQLEIERKDLVLAALDDYRAGRGDFADCLIGRGTVAAGGSATVTFDRGLRKNPLFKLL